MVQPYISEATAASIGVARQRLFATSKLLGRTVSLTLWRDSETDGTAEEVAPQEVLIVMAGREASTNQNAGAQVVLADGELRKEPPFDVQEDDRFTLPEGLHGRITVAPIIGTSYVRAPFSLES